jgi:hypothetical protein
MVGGSVRVLQLLPPLKLVAILLKVALKHQKSNQNLETILLFEYNLLSYNFSSPSDIDEYTLLVWFLEIFYEYEV